VIAEDKAAATRPLATAIACAPISCRRIRRTGSTRRCCRRARPPRGIEVILPVAEIMRQFIADAEAALMGTGCLHGDNLGENAKRPHCAAANTVRCLGQNGLAPLARLMGVHDPGCAKTSTLL
jgi:hypothetical protein